MIIASLCLILLVVWILAFDVVALILQQSMAMRVDDLLLSWLIRGFRIHGVIVLACVAAIAAGLGLGRRRAVAAMPWWGPWWVWMGWAVCSGWVSIDRGLSVRACLMMLAYGLVACAIVLVVRSPKDLRLWTRFVMLVAVIVSLHGVWQYVQTFEATLPLMAQLRESGELTMTGWGIGVIEDFLVRKRIFSVFGWPNLFAGFLLLVIPIGLGLRGASSTRWSRTAWGLASALGALCLCLTLSLGAWIAACLTCILVWGLRRRRMPRGSSATPARRPVWHAMIWVGIVVVAIGGASAIVSQRAWTMVRASTISRLAYVEGSWAAMTARPLTGTGPGTFGLAYQTHKPLERIEGSHNARHAHNTLLEIGTELGWIGLVCSLVFFTAVGRLVVPALRDPSREPLAHLRWGVAVGVLGFFVHGLLEQTMVIAVTAPFWWLALGLLTASSGMDGDGRPALVSPGFWGRRRVVLVVAGAMGLLLTLRFGVADYQAARAMQLARAGDIEGMRHAFVRAEHLDPLAHDYALQQGQWLMRSADEQPRELRGAWLAAGQESFERAVRLSPWLSVAWSRLGLIRWERGQSDEAVAAMQLAVQHDPNSRAAHLALAKMLRARGDWVQLQAVARRLQQLEPLRPDGWMLEALALQSVGADDHARRLYESLLERMPDYAPALLNLAGILERQQDVESALRVLSLVPAANLARKEAQDRLKQLMRQPENGLFLHHENSP